MRAAYYGGSLTGSGQTLGLVEYYGTDLADLQTYYTNAKQTYPGSVITLYSTDGTSTSCVDSVAGGKCDDTEQTLDMTQALGMAPGLSSLVVFVGSSDAAVLNAMATRTPLALSLSSSWTWSPADPSVDDPYFKEFATQGQNFFQASGDSGAWTLSSGIYPADDVYVTTVGGTDLSTSSAGGAWSAETAWADGGGGVSPDKYAIPSWQVTAAASCSSCSQSYRNGPDVSANANFTYYVCADQTTCTANHFGGTSFAAPLWAGYLALVNQQRASNGNGLLGFINPSLYQIGSAGGATYSTAFHDITSGSDGYSAAIGYDLATGWGSPNGAGLLNALAGTGTAAAASLSPALSFPNTLSGTTSSALSATLSNTGTATLNNIVPSIVGTNPGDFALSTGANACGLTLAAGSSCSIYVTFTPASAASFSATLSVADSATGSPQTVSLSGTGTSSASSFTISVSPGSESLALGYSGSVVVTTTAAGSFNSVVALSVSNLPSGVMSGFTPASIAAPGSGTANFNLYATTSATPGTYSVTITGTGGGVTKSTTLTLTLPGTGTTSLSPALSFPNTPAGTTSSALSAKLSNTGTAALSNIVPSIVGINPGDFALTTGANACGSTLAAGSSCSIYVTFTPASAASFSATLSVADNATGSPQTVSLSGTGTAPAASLGPALSFPNTPAGTTSSALAATLSNTGTATLNNIVPSITGTNPSDFALSTGANACGSTLAAGSSCSIYVTFTPASAASFSATLSVADNAAGSPQSVSLSGTGTAPAASLGPALSFPNTPAGTTSSALAATLSNTGTATLNNIVPSIVGTNPGDFALSTGANACGSTLAAGSSCSIYVTFTPASAASFSATLSVADNATGSPQTVSLSGTGTAPIVSLSPALSFPNTLAGTTSAALAATLSNTGTAPLNNIVPSIVGTNPGDFALSTGANACGSTLAAGSSCSIYVTFTPASATSFSAMLSVADSATGSPQTVSLSGTGTAPAASLGPALSFPNTLSGTTSSALAATLSNTGTAALNNIVSSIVGTNPGDFALSTGANACGSTLAAGSSCSIYVTFTPASAASFSATLSVADNATGSPQTVSLSGTGTSSASSFTISVPPGSGSLTVGYSGTVVVTTTATGSFNSAVALSVSNLPSGVMSGFTPASIAAPGSGKANFNLYATSSAKAGTYPVTITGTGGGTTESTTLTLTILP